MEDEALSRVNFFVVFVSSLYPSTGFSKIIMFSQCLHQEHPYEHCMDFLICNTFSENDTALIDHMDWFHFISWFSKVDSVTLDSQVSGISSKKACQGNFSLYIGQKIMLSSFFALGTKIYKDNSINS